ncbi:hypothetical protein [Yinghuangia soli]|uniref:Uncharacterized protein n=1 Tax=Yinghuangia soli TaxID=2908204 RepID=A0AA41PXM7_9ACTN|nr:hypothetical protein [Yinghuangia soli]MCF2527091.1 hypothetical protein [Yinghuangia soli]
MRRPTHRYQYVRREPTVMEYVAMLGPALVVVGLGYLALLLLIGLGGAGVAAVVWVCGFFLFAGLAHARPTLKLLRWAWLAAGACVVLTML